MAMPSGSMKQTLATVIAIWCAATSSAPSRPISKAVATNKPPSMKIATPIGSPSASRPRITGQSGRSKRANSCKSAKRRERRRKIAKPIACAHSTMAVAMPSPAAPRPGSGPAPNIRT